MTETRHETQSRDRRPERDRYGETKTTETSFWRRFVTALPMRVSLLAVSAVWIAGCVWSFEEQTAFAQSRGFAVPELLPLIVDGFAAAVAGVAYAASLDGRPAVAARLGTALAVAGSAASNATWAWSRSGQDDATIALAIAVPVVANLAFEVLLGELRRQTERRRGTKPPVKIPYPRMIRLVLSPPTFFPWRRLVLDLTDPAREIAGQETSTETSPALLVPTPTIGTETPVPGPAAMETPSPRPPAPRSPRTSPVTQTATVRSLDPGEDDARLAILRERFENWETETPTTTEIKECLGISGQKTALRLRTALVHAAEAAETAAETNTRDQLAGERTGT